VVVQKLPGARHVVSVPVLVPSVWVSSCSECKTWALDPPSHARAHHVSPVVYVALSVGPSAVVHPCAVNKMTSQLFRFLVCMSLGQPPQQPQLRCMFANMCGVQCVRQTPAVVPVTTGTEHRFFHDDLRGCFGHKGCPPEVDFCAAVHRMHTDVLCGRVSATRAARMACALDDDEDLTDDGFSFLHYLLVYTKHTATCRCLEKVLSWGTCPHVVLVDADRAMMITPLTRPYFVLRYNPADIQLLLLYGTLPWPSFVMSDGGAWIGDMEEQVVELHRRNKCHQHNVPFTALPLAQRQWRQWHCRQMRRRMLLFLR
jgi:hypothetical protein